MRKAKALAISLVFVAAMVTSSNVLAKPRSGYAPCCRMKHCCYKNMKCCKKANHSCCTGHKAGGACCCKKGSCPMPNM